MGPTGVGKTDLAIELYKNLGINIISVDSVQIYKHLNIGSGKPSSNVLDKSLIVSTTNSKLALSFPSF